MPGPPPLVLRDSRSLVRLAGAVFWLGSLLFLSSLSAQTTIAPIPAEVSSSHFVVEIDGHKSAVLHAAANYYLLNFEVSGPVDISVTASDPHFWDAGVEVQPMRLGIRPARVGGTIRFHLGELAKLSITRPGDHFGGSEMLFLFANAPDGSGISAATPGVRFYGPGIHRGSITATSGETIYLADGAVVFGALNFWQVHNVKVLGGGTLIYDGPQDPDHDQGWMHKPDWHAIVMDEARDIDIQGITAIVRSRTWMVQMRLSRKIRFSNVKVIGGSKGNANQDGMDWLGGGDTLIQDSFIRAADDIFAMYGSWLGYGDKELSTPGEVVSNIRIENSVLSTSISNVVRLSWPRQVFDSHDFTLRDSDVIHMGAGGCGIPFALFEVWADKGARGTHTNYNFEDLRLDDWYSLTQIIQPNPVVQGVHFTNIAAMDSPQLVASELKGSIRDVSLRGVSPGSDDAPGDGGLQVEATDGAGEPTYAVMPMMASFTYPSGLIQPGREVTFTAKPVAGGHFRWLFGDGSAAEGAVVRHAFPDTQGTLLDGTGRFRVLLAMTDGAGRTTWSSQPVIVASQLRPALTTPEDRVLAGPASSPEQVQSFDALLRIPASGGYSLLLLTSTTSSIAIDGMEARSAPLQAQVCGSQGYAVQAVRVNAALAAGLHRLEVRRGSEMENASGGRSGKGQPVLYWQGPGLAWQPIPETALSHTKP